MFPTQFKLTKVGELTRRLTFPEPPNWSSLAFKIKSVYGIPESQVAVSYIDKDGDEVTLNTQDELVDFFINCQDRKSTRLNSSHSGESRMPSSA